MSFRKIKVKSGNEESTLEVTEEEYRNYYYYPKRKERRRIWQIMREKN